MFGRILENWARLWGPHTDDRHEVRDRQEVGEKVKYEIYLLRRETQIGLKGKREEKRVI